MELPEYHFPTDYSSIWQRVKNIDPVKYAATRNYLDGAVSYLSPYFTHGVISLPLVANQVLSKCSFKQSEKFIFELAWREYFRRVWENKGEEIWTDLKRDQPRAEREGVPISILQAKTGIQSLDTCLQSLQQNGYMHNHARMWVAMLACNIGRVHWMKPAQWLYYYLLDGDLASNTLGWQWVSGAFSGKIYLANQDNINKYSGSKQQGTFLDSSYEVLEQREIPKTLRDVSKIRLRTKLPKCSTLSLNPDLPTLLYHPWSLDPKWHQNEAWNRVLVLEPSHFKQHPISPQRVQFVLDLAQEIPGLQVYVGEVQQLQLVNEAVYLAHPAMNHFPGKPERPGYLFPQVDGYFKNFFSYWKQCQTFVAAESHV